MLARPDRVRLQWPPPPAVMDMPDHPNNWHAALNRPQERTTTSSNPVGGQSVNEFHALGVTRVHGPSFALATSFGPVPYGENAPVMPPSDHAKGIGPSSRFPSCLAGMHEQIQVIISRREGVRGRRANERQHMAKGTGHGYERKRCTSISNT